MFVIIASLTVLALLLSYGAYFLTGVIVRRIAKPDEDQGKTDEDKQKAADARRAQGLPERIPKRAKYFVAPEGNSTGYIVDMRTRSGGTKILDLVPNVPGKIVVKPDRDDELSWYLGDGERKRTFWERLYGVYWIGVFTELRANTVREVRVALIPATGVYDLVQKAYSNLDFVHNSREMVVEIDDAETEAQSAPDGTEIPGYRIKARFIVKYWEKFPARARQGVADPNSFLAGLVAQAAEAKFKTKDTNHYLFGPNQLELTGSIKTAIKTEAEDVVGHEVTHVALLLIEVHPEDRAKMQAQADAIQVGRGNLAIEQQKAIVAEAALIAATKEAEVAVAKAKGERRVKLLENNADANYVATVTNVAGKTEYTALAFAADRIGKMPLSSLVLGNGVMPTLPLPAPTPSTPTTP